jgi:hypothetical protein
MAHFSSTNSRTSTKAFHAATKLSILGAHLLLKRSHTDSNPINSIVERCFKADPTQYIHTSDSHLATASKTELLKTEGLEREAVRVEHGARHGGDEVSPPQARRAALRGVQPEG